MFGFPKNNINNGVVKGKPKEDSSLKKKELEKQVVYSDRELVRSKGFLSNVERKYKRALAEIDILEKEKEAMLKLYSNISSYNIKPSKGYKSEATACIIASDWHYEETIKSVQVNGLNEFNLKIADIRINNFFKNSLSLINICQKDVDIKVIVLALLGDFISGTIHEELLESNQLLVTDAILRVQSHLISGINFLLANTKANLVIPCHSGNHARMTTKSRIATEYGNSLEFLMYNTIKMVFAGNKRVKFIIPTGYHSYVTIYDKVIRFHHGHQMRYGGGVGGIYIPVNKAIAQWNKSKWADLDIFGHFHQFRDGGNFICNGSVVGYNDYALAIKADFEEPRQAFILIDKNRGKTIVAPILVNQN